MDKKEDEIKKIGKKVVRYLEHKWNLKIPSALIFGSYVYGSPHEGSDIDIAIFSPQLEGKNIETKASISASVKLQVDTRAEVHLFSTSALNEARDTNFIGFILQNGKKIK